MQGFLKRLLAVPDAARLRRRAQQDPTPRSHLELCRRLQIQGRARDAMEEARAGLLRFPYCRDLQDILRSTWKRECKGLLRNLEQRAASSPSLESYGELIRHLLQYGEQDLAVTWAQRMLAHLGEDEQALVLHGRVLETRFRRDHVALDGATALQSYRKASDMSPGSFEPAYLLACLQAYIGAVSKALHHLFLALDANPDHAGALALQRRLSHLPLERESESALLGRMEENDGSDVLGGWNKEDAAGRCQDGGAKSLAKGVQRLSSMAGVGRVVLSMRGRHWEGHDGRLAVCERGHEDAFSGLAHGFRRVASLSAKRMGIGGLQEAEISWGAGHLLAFAAGPTVLVLELADNPALKAVAREARSFVSACTRLETEAGEGGKP